MTVTRNKAQRTYKPRKTTGKQALSAWNSLKGFVRWDDSGHSYLDESGTKHICHSITKQSRQLYQRYKSGERDLWYTKPNGTKAKWNWGLQYFRNLQNADKIQDHLNGITQYYTSSDRGLALFYLDIDAHKPWQTDQKACRELLEKIFSTAYWQTSKRGENGWLKVQYIEPGECNEARRQLQEAVRDWMAAKGLLCDFEVLGGVTQDELENGSAHPAKLPFLDTPEKLAEFNACKTLALSQVEEVISFLRADTDQMKAILGKLKRNELTGKRTRNAKVSTQQPEPKSASQSERKSTPKPESKRVHSLPTVSYGDLEPDAFKRNTADVKRLCRDFYKAHRCLPSTEELLEALQETGRYSGDWDDRLKERERRVDQCRRYTEQDFDPSKLSKGKEKSGVTLDEIKQHSLLGYVRRHIDCHFAIRTARAIKQRPDARRWYANQLVPEMDPFTMTAKPTTHKIFIEPERVDFFLRLIVWKSKHMPENNGVSTEWFKTMYRILGQPFNQEEFQALRDYFDGRFYQIYDKDHAPGKCWRWRMTEEHLPEFDHATHEQKEKISKAMGVEPYQAVSLHVGSYTLEQIIRSQLPDPHEEREEERVHNTLCITESTRISSFFFTSSVRPPPWLPRTV